MKLPYNLRTLDGSKPHKSWRGWRGFITKNCELRDSHEETFYYGVTNCNYIILPNGVILSNYGYKGRVLMERIREDGWEVVLEKAKAIRREIESVLKDLRR